MNEDVSVMLESETDSTSFLVYKKLLEGRAICHFTGVNVNVDNLHAVFSLEDDIVKFCSNSEDAIESFELISNRLDLAQ